MNWQELIVYIVLILCFVVIVLQQKLWRKFVYSKKQVEGKISCPNACQGCKCGCVRSIELDKIEIDKRAYSFN